MMKRNIPYIIFMAIAIAIFIYAALVYPENIARNAAFCTIIVVAAIVKIIVNIVLYRKEQKNNHKK